MMRFVPTRWVGGVEVHVTAEAVGEKVAEGGDPLIPRTKTIPELLDRAARL